MLNLMLLKFMTMNTDDENRDEIEALEVQRTRHLSDIHEIICFLSKPIITRIY